MGRYTILFLTICLYFPKLLLMESRHQEKYQSTCFLIKIIEMLVWDLTLITPFLKDDIVLLRIVKCTKQKQFISLKRIYITF